MNTLLEITHLKKSFIHAQKGSVAVVDVPHFSLGSSELIGLEGLSGSGKTTFLHLIAGILRPDEGCIIFNGKDVSVLDESRRDRWRARHVGYVFQTFNLLQGYTAFENICLAMSFGRGVDRAFARELLERVGLGTYLHAYPKQMSIGQQQRVAVARALANRPELVLADEPTGNLDSRHAKETVELIKDICAGQKAALIFVSHDRHILQSFNKTFSMADINKAGHS